MAIKVRSTGDAGRVPGLDVRGEVDLFAAPEFRERVMALLEDEPEAIIIDLRRATFLDAGACRTLLRAARLIEAREGRLVVINTNPEIARTFDVMGLCDLITVVETDEAARAAVTSS